MTQVGQLNRNFSVARILSRGCLGAGGSTPFPCRGRFERDSPVLRTLSQTHTELPHAGKWHVAIWPGWLRKLLGTDRKALGRRWDAQAHRCGGHLPRQATVGLARLPLCMGLAQGKSQVQTNSHACCCPIPQTQAKTLRGGGSFSVPSPHMFLSQSGPQKPRISPSLPRTGASASGLAKPGTWLPLTSFLPSSRKVPASMGR